AGRSPSIGAWSSTPPPARPARPVTPARTISVVSGYGVFSNTQRVFFFESQAWGPLTTRFFLKSQVCGLAPQGLPAPAPPPPPPADPRRGHALGPHPPRLAIM